MDARIKDIANTLTNSSIRDSIVFGKFGIEKENVRVDEKGKMSQTPHPGILGDKFYHPYITTDFSESQVEMISPPLDNIEKTHGFLETLQDVITENIENELLWPQSFPPLLPDEEQIPIARFGEKGAEREKYREELARIYGRERQMISGLHFNFSLDATLEQKLLKALDWKDGTEEFKGAVYTKIFRNFMRYRWLLVWLFGGSPIADPTFQIKSLKTGEKKHLRCESAVSLRSSSGGYRNKEEFYIDCSSVETYIQSIDKLVKNGKLIADKELYLPMRIKFIPKTHRVSHLEIRLFDLDPFEKTGISKEALYFTHFFLLYALFKEETGEYSAGQQLLATINQEMVSCFGLNQKLLLTEIDGCTKDAVTMAQSMFDEMKEFAEDSGLIQLKEYSHAFEMAGQWVKNPEKRPSQRLKEQIESKGFIDFHLEKARQYREDSLKKGFNFHGFEDLELSTQLLMRAALRRGVEFEVIDHCDNFIRLSRGDKTEYVMQATRTSLDSYSSVLMMENKLVTKKILEQNGICVPPGTDYMDIVRAKSDFSLYEGRAIVIKPKSTNFGIGITILKENTNKEIFCRAIDMAFKQDNSILIEEFIAGKEFRFFVIGDRVEGILHRIPANVTGNGKNTIRELVQEKNRNPLRGKGYRTPLEKIRLEEPEAMFLQEQGLSFDSILPENQIVYLRENSNISTGGDSIDYTDTVHPSYKEIAVKAAEALNVKITGLDMMIIDVNKPATESNYAIIEMNFNPAIHIHCYPLVGVNRQLNEKILNVLGF